MKLTIAFLVGATLCDATMARAQNSARPEAPAIYVGLFSVSQNGARGHAALTADKSGDIAGTVYLTPCSGGAAASPGLAISAFATDAWRMTGKVLEMNDREASVQLESQRLRRAGVDEKSAPESLTLTLKRGERKTLETMPVVAAVSCEEKSSSLQVFFGTRDDLYVGSPSGYTVNGKDPGSFRGEWAGKALKEFISPFATADLWLVRTTPGRADETLHLATTVMPIPRPFEFAPIVIQSSVGTLSVKVEGTIESGRSADGEARLHFTATRAVTALTTPRPVGENKPTIEGSTKTTITLPGPDEVLSFEMPPLRTSDGVTLPDRLSIRLRLTPK
jgi:hypothetical protein